MPYEDPNKKPEPHYVVVVQVKEVTPAHETGSGATRARHEKVVEDMFSVSLKDADYQGALTLAMAHLETAKVAG
jgi:hypothetical protein